jgi:putative transposase
VVAVSSKGSGRVSIAGLVCLQYGRRGRLMWRTKLHRGRKGERGSFSEDDYIAFLDQAPPISGWLHRSGWSGTT